MNLQQSNTYRELPIEFIGVGEVAGYYFKQVFTDGKWYIYLVNINSKPSHYETLQRREIIATNTKYAKENYVAYPRSNAFGVWAWTAKTLEHAKQIIAKHKQHSLIEKQI